MATVQTPQTDVKIPVPTTKSGAIGTYTTVAKWAQGEGQPQGSASGTFTGPATPADIEVYLKPLNSAERARFFRDWFYGADLRKKASLRPAASEDSPWITRDNVRINLATGERLNTKTNIKLADLPLEKRIAAVNTGFADADTYGGDPKSCFVVAKRMLLEGKVAAEANGKLVVAKK